MRAGLTILAALAAWAVVARAADPIVIAVVVHPERHTTVTRRDLARVFLKKRRQWPDGSPIVPINHPAESTVREVFTRRVYEDWREHLAEYWSEQYFHGVFPPVTMPSGEAVKRYVASDPNAIGYLNARDVDPTVRVVLRLAPREN